MNRKKKKKEYPQDNRIIPHNIEEVILGLPRCECITIDKCMSDLPIGQKGVCATLLEHVEKVTSSCLSSGDVFGSCLRVVKTELVLTRDHLCLYRHDELEHVYFQSVFSFFQLRNPGQLCALGAWKRKLTFEDYLAAGIYVADLGRMDIYTQENCEQAHAGSFRSCA